MAAGNKNSVVLIQARCDDVGDTSWIFEPSQAVSEFQIVLKLSLVPGARDFYARDTRDRSLEDAYW